MATSRETIVDLEKRFWQSMIDSDTDTALAMLSEPSTLVSTHGAMKFDHDTYRRMAESGDFTAGVVSAQRRGRHVSVRRHGDRDLQGQAVDETPRRKEELPLRR